MKDLILDKSTIKRRKAAVFYRKNSLTSEDICDLLLKALKLEEVKTSWLTQVELIKTIGIRKCTIARDYIKSYFVDNGEEYSLLTMVSATALVRIERKNLQDVSLVLDLIKDGRYSLVEGALDALGYDHMLPSIKDQSKIISSCKDFGSDRKKGYTDPRYSLAAACAKWDADLVKPFLMDCITSNDAPLKYVAEKSLERKYIKLR